MTASKNPTVTKLEDIQSLLDAAPKDAVVDNAAPKEQPAASGAVPSLATQMREKAEALGVQYLAHRLSGGKKKAFLATLTEEDATFFRVLRIDEVVAESIAKDLAEKAKATTPETIEFDRLVEKEKAKQKAAKENKKAKEDIKTKKSQRKNKLFDAIDSLAALGITKRKELTARF
jgi:hypothetical protein